jgi:hypothetical protein
VFPPPDPDDIVIRHEREPWPDHWIVDLPERPLVFIDQDVALLYVGWH